MNKQQIIVDKIYPAKDGKNQDYLTMQLSAKIASAGSVGAIGVFLGGDFTSKRVTFQSIHKDQLSKMAADGLEVGADLNTVFDGAFQLKVTELSQAEYDGLSEVGKLGFQEKRRPQKEDGTEGDLMTAGGFPIWRKIELCGINEGSDKLVKADASESTNTTQGEAVAEKPAVEA